MREAEARAFVATMTSQIRSILSKRELTQTDGNKALGCLYAGLYVLLAWKPEGR